MHRAQIETILSKIYPRPILADTTSRRRIYQYRYIYILGSEWNVSDFMVATILTGMTPRAALFGSYSEKIPAAPNLIIIGAGPDLVGRDTERFLTISRLPPGDVPPWVPLGDTIGRAVITALSRPPTPLSRLVSTYIRISNLSGSVTLESLYGWDGADPTSITANAIRNWCNYTIRLIASDSDGMKKIIRGVSQCLTQRWAEIPAPVEDYILRLNDL